MNAKIIALGVVLLGFVDLTAWAIYQHGYLGFFELVNANAATRLLALDLVISLVLIGVWDTSVRVVGGWDGQLSDGGEEVRLLRPDSPPAENPSLIPTVTEDAIFYDDLAPWPAGADGQGSSLARRVPTSFGGNVASWVAAAATPGSVDFSGGVRGDFTGDGQVDADDIDVLFDAVRHGSNVTFHDIDNNFVVNDGDVSHLVETILGTRFGDANLDGNVDGQDFNTWNTHRFQRCTGWSMGDFTGDGSTDGSDFNVWNQHKFLAVAAAVGEPARTPRSPLAGHVPGIDPQLIDRVMTHRSRDWAAYAIVRGGVLPGQQEERSSGTSQDVRIVLAAKHVSRLGDVMMPHRRTSSRPWNAIDDIFALLAFEPFDHS